MAEAKLIKVKSNLEDKSRVAFFEQHPAHPGGEVYITGEAEFEVARTRQVLWAIGAGHIVEVGVPKEETLAAGSDEGKPLVDDKGEETKTVETSPKGKR
jgi:hypothetical protein